MVGLYEDGEPVGTHCAFNYSSLSTTHFDFENRGKGRGDGKF